MNQLLIGRIAIVGCVDYTDRNERVEWYEQLRIMDVMCVSVDGQTYWELLCADGNGRLFPRTVREGEVRVQKAGTTKDDFVSQYRAMDCPKTYRQAVQALEERLEREGGGA
jgi:hypothetical protein